MKLHTPSRETMLYALALILALGLRLYNLGAASLADYEASAALQALQAARPGNAVPTFGPQITYIALTAPLFFLVNSSNFIARLWPALAGTLLVGLPILLRKRLGRGVALILAFGLALDPGLVTVSRQAGGVMLALSLSLLALALWENRRFILTGIAGGLAVLCGPAVLIGLVGMALTGLVLRLARQPLWSEPESPALPAPQRRAAWRETLISAAVTIALAGTLFLRYPQGIAAWAQTLPAYLQGWATSSGIPAGMMALALAAYQPAALLLALTGIVAWLVQQLSPTAVHDEPIEADPAIENTLYEVRSTDEPGADSAQRTTPNVQRPLLPLPPLAALLWFALGLLLAIIYPARQAADLTWVLVPLWLLAAWSLDTLIIAVPDAPKPRLNPIALAHGALMLVLCNLFWMTLIATRWIDPLPGVAWPVVQWGIILVVLVLGGVIGALVAMGWGWPVSRDGLAWGLGITLLVYNIGALWGAAQLRPNMPEELWGQPPAAVQVELFQQTMNDLSKWQTGLPDTLEIVSLVDTPALRWALRDFPQTSFMSAPPPGKRPAILITAQDQNAPELSASYRGQDFLWSAWRGWEGSLPPDFLTWLAFRKAPTQGVHIILWMRADLKPAGGILELPAEEELIIPEDSMPANNPPPAEEEGPK